MVPKGLSLCFIEALQISRLFEGSMGAPQGAMMAPRAGKALQKRLLRRMCRFARILFMVRQLMRHPAAMPSAWAAPVKSNETVDAGI